MKFFSLILIVSSSSRRCRNRKVIQWWYTCPSITLANRQVSMECRSLSYISSYRKLSHISLPVWASCIISPVMVASIRRVTYNRVKAIVRGLVFLLNQNIPNMNSCLIKFLKLEDTAAGGSSSSKVLSDSCFLVFTLTLLSLMSNSVSLWFVLLCLCFFSLAR